MSYMNMTRCSLLLEHQIKRSGVQYPSRNSGAFSRLAGMWARQDNCYFSHSCCLEKGAATARKIIPNPITSRMGNEQTKEYTCSSLPSFHSKFSFNCLVKRKSHLLFNFYSFRISDAFIQLARISFSIQMKSWKVYLSPFHAIRPHTQSHPDHHCQSLSYSHSSHLRQCHSSAPLLLPITCHWTLGVFPSYIMLFRKHSMRGN